MADFPIKFDANVFKNINFKPIFNEELANTNARIQKNLDQGKRSDGSAMKAYSPGYAAKQQAKTGRAVVDMLVTGELRRSFTLLLDTNPRSAQLIFSGTHSTAGMQNSTLVETLYGRGFDGWVTFAKQDLDRIDKRVRKEIDEIVKKSI